MIRFLPLVLVPLSLSSCRAAGEARPANGARSRMYAEGPLEYTVLQGEEVYLSLNVAAWGPNWRWFGFGGAATTDAGGARVFQQTTALGGTEKKLNLKHEARQGAGGSVVLSYEFQAPEQARLTQVCASVTPAAAFFSSGKCVAKLTGGEEKELKLPFGRGSVGDSVEALVLIDRAGNEVTLTLRPPRPVSMDGDGRLQLVGETLAAGETRRTEIGLSVPGGLKFYANDAETVQRDDTPNWFPYPVGPAGVPIDLSFLNKDANGNYVPAGAHGFVTVKGDEFAFEDGTPARFWGVNLTAGAVLSSEERAEQLAERVARLGCNLVRFHHLDSWANPIIDYDHPDGTTQHLKPESMRLLDKAVFELKRRGVYVVLDPWVQRCFKEADGVADYGNLGQRGNFNLHPYIYFDARMQELIQKQWGQVWTHVNEFTGVAYKDEPACALTECINEGLLTGLGGVKPGFYRDEVVKLYDAWAKANNGVPAEQTTIFTQNYGDNNLRFFTHLHQRFYQQSSDFFRKLGVRIPLNATNWAHFTWVMAAQTGLDFMDSHHYYGGDRIGPGSGMGGLWLSHPPNLPDTPFGKLAGFAVPGKPLAASECGNNPPKTYRAAYQLGLAALAAFQGWDAFTGYAYSQGGRPGDKLGAFEWETDPASVAGVAAGALIFRRGDVSPAKQTVAFDLPEQEILTLRWENGGEKQYWNTAGFNCAVEEHRVVVCPPGFSAESLKPVRERTPFVRTLNVEDSFAYKHPGTELRSDTGELWRNWQLGVGTLDTPRSQAAYGKLGESGRAWQTEDCTFDLKTPFAVTALSNLTNEPLARSGKLLLTAVARAENTGMTFNLARTKIASQGAAPVLAEPVVGAIRLKTSQKSLTLYPIRADGTRGEGVELAVSDGVATIELKDGYQTIFYEIEAAGGR
jgi:hypothetical protein